MSAPYRVYRFIAISLGVLFFAFAALFVYMGFSKLSDAQEPCPARVDIAVTEPISSITPHRNELHVLYENNRLDVHSSCNGEKIRSIHFVK